MASRVIIIGAFLIFCFIDFGYCRQPSEISVDMQYQIELEKRLQILNKPPVKTITDNEIGDVYDCIPIAQQPAFDHPALKHHKIQLRPLFSPPLLVRSPREDFMKLDNTSETCPSGTVPIKRTTKEDLIRSDRELLAMKDEKALSRNANLKLEKHGKLFGSGFVMSLYNLNIGDDQESSAEVRLEAGPPGQVDVLSVGWKVSMGLNGDKFTRLFGYWHDGSQNKGCYGTLCPGFVQVDPNFPINFLFKNTSVYGNYTLQRATYLKVIKAPDSGNWWLMGGEQSTISIGYWPKELFPNLASGADTITWGGATSPGANGDYPPMGNGHLPDGYYKDTCYFSSVRYINSLSHFIAPSESDTTISIDSPRCYGLQIVTPNEELENLGFSFMFGGPGGQCS